MFVISSSIVLYRLDKVISWRLLGNNWIFLVLQDSSTESKYWERSGSLKSYYHRKLYVKNLLRYRKIRLEFCYLRKVFRQKSIEVMENRVRILVALENSFLTNISEYVKENISA